MRNSPRGHKHLPLSYCHIAAPSVPRPIQYFLTTQTSKTLQDPYCRSSRSTLPLLLCPTPLQIDVFVACHSSALFLLDDRKSFEMVYQILQPFLELKRTTLQLIWLMFSLIWQVILLFEGGEQATLPFTRDNSLLFSSLAAITLLLIS